METIIMYVHDITSDACHVLYMYVCVSHYEITVWAADIQFEFEFLNSGTCMHAYKLYICAVVH